VTVAREGDWFVVYDASYGEPIADSQHATLDAAERRANVRRGVIRAALTRRTNKARSDRVAARQAACAAADVTWSWLRETLTEAEADAWLGIDQKES
jgi:hypothetical protein